MEELHFRNMDEAGGLYFKCKELVKGKRAGTVNRKPGTENRVRGD
jgi:hypothetical protein